MVGPLEAVQTRKFIKRYREIRPDAVIVKPNDRVTPGIRDFFLADFGHTWHIEAKRSSNTLSDLQKRMLERLHAATYGRAGVLWFDDATGTCVLSFKGVPELTAPSPVKMAEVFALWLGSKSVDIRPPVE